MKIFVTVGSTQFSELTDRFQQLDWLLKAIPELCQLTIQHGSAPFTCPHTQHSVKVEAFPYTASLDRYIAESDLVISHAGSGSILECLRSTSSAAGGDVSAKRLVVVVNERLMDNHQWELASALHSRQHLLATDCARLEETVCQAVNFQFTPYPPADRQAFRRVLVEQLHKLDC